MLNDLRSCRMLLRSPGFTAVVVTTFALSIGANAAHFSVVRAVLLRPLPCPDPNGLMVVLDRMPPQLPEFAVAPTPYVVGIALTRPKNDCPFFVWRVELESPADKAGIIAGERLLAVDGKRLYQLNLQQTLELLRSDKPGTVALKLWRRGKEYEVVLPRERYSSILSRRGLKQIGNLIFPLDASEAETDRMLRLTTEEERLVAHPFPSHYPSNPDLFHGGFALLIFRSPREVFATGVENGPASRAGLRQGDRIVSVNGANLAQKTPQETEAMFSGSRSELIHLEIDRGGIIKTIEYRTERAAAILKQNQLRMVNGQVVPAGLADEDIKCFAGTQ